MKLRAYAKINLGIHILAKRPDGFHDLETVFHQINQFDEIELTPSHTIELTTHSPDVPKDSTNLCVRAAALLREKYNSRLGVRIDLNKHVPVGSGLGGGSSDAAAILNGLLAMWNLPKEPEVLQSLAENLGSDVPFFLEGGTALARGRGELLTHFELRVPFWIVVATPPVKVSTAWAYSRMEIPRRKVQADLRSTVERMMSNSTTKPETLTNDFETLVFASYPEIGTLKDTMLRSGAAYASLSGSGSSVFGLFRDGGSARASASRFPATYHVSLTEPLFKPEPRAL